MAAVEALRVGKAGAQISIQPSKAPCIPEEPPRNHARLPLCSFLALVERKQTVVRVQFSPQNPPGSSTQGFNTLLARRRQSCFPPSPNMVFTHPGERATESMSVLRRRIRRPASRVPPPPEGHQCGRVFPAGVGPG